MIDRATIKSLVPHAGKMCLIDSVKEWNETMIHCTAHTGSPPDHPLSAGNVLPATALAEYGAQAMAIHGTLLAEPGSPVRQGWLVSLAGLEHRIEHLDAATALKISAQRMGSDAGGASYQFSVHGNDRLLAQGRATVMFPEAEEFP